MNVWLYNATLDRVLLKAGIILKWKCAGPKTREARGKVRPEGVDSSWLGPGSQWKIHSPTKTGSTALNCLWLKYLPESSSKSGHTHLYFMFTCSPQHFAAVALSLSDLRIQSAHATVTSHKACQSSLQYKWSGRKPYGRNFLFRLWIIMLYRTVTSLRCLGFQFIFNSFSIAIYGRSLFYKAYHICNDE